MSQVSLRDEEIKGLKAKNKKLAEMIKRKEEEKKGSLRIRIKSFLEKMRI